MWIILYILASAGLLGYLNKENIAYNLIYLYSSIQILINKITNVISIKTTKTITTHDVYTFESINDVQISEFVEYKKKFIDNPEMTFAKNPDAKMIIFNDTIDNVTNKICYYKPYENITSKYEISNVSFISFKVNVESNEYNIKLSTPEYNFYIVGNEINEQWIKYYFRKYLNNNLLDMFDYTIEIVDENVNFVNISQNDTIRFTKETYEIIKYENENNNIKKDEKEENDNQD